MNIQHTNKFLRICSCGKEVWYKDEKWRDQAIKNNKKCKSCIAMGENNPMYNRSLYDVWIEKYGKDEADRIMIEYRDKHKIKYSDEVNKKKGRSGSHNSMAGKSVYSVWLEKYGKNEAEKRLKKQGDKIRHKVSGINNPMYGKPSPSGSGNGWSGWYKKFYFRSLLELSYLKYLIDNDIKFRSAETNEFRIKYINSFTKKERTYCPDFYLEESDELIEIKPKNLINSIENKDKFKKAKKIFGKKFKIITEKNLIKLTNDEIKNLHDNDELKFIDRYEEKFKEKYS